MMNRENLLQIFKFIIVGGIATIIDWVVYFILYNFFKFNPLLANILSFCVSVIYNFTASVKWVFNVDKNKSKKSTMIEFFALSIIGLFLSEILLWILISKMLLNNMFSKILSTIIVMIFNFVTRKIFLENKINYEYILSSRRFQKFINFLFALFFLIGYDYYFYRNLTFGNQSIFNILFLFLIYCMLEKINTEKKSSSKLIAFIFSFILSMVVVVGRDVYIYNKIDNLFENYDAIIFNLISIIGFTKVIGELINIAFIKITNLENKTDSKKWKILKNKNAFWLILGFILCCWIPIYIAYYPGIYAYDMSRQMGEITTGVFTKYHPPLHTFFFKACLALGNNMHNALVIYSILQMLFMTVVFSLLINYFIKKKFNKWVILFSILFFALNPVVVVFSLMTTKDVFFAGFLILFTIEIMKLVENVDQYLNNPVNWIKYISFGVMTCLFRNNAIYALILAIPVFAIILKKYWKKVSILMILVIIGFYLINDGVYGLLKVKEGDSRESLSVPIQQISYVVKLHDKELNINNKKIINKFLPYNEIVKRYNYRFADRMKGMFKSDYFDDNKMEFIKLWVKLFINYPKDYVSAFLTLNIPYWYPDANSLDVYNKRQYIESNLLSDEYYKRENESILPNVFNTYNELVSYKMFEKVPLISTFFALSTPIWLIMFTLFSLIYKKHYKLILILVPSLLIWLTYMAGPVSNFRYMYPLICLYPLFIALIFNSKKIK